MQENHAMFRILLAEDNKDNQAAYRRMLEGAGYDIDIAENGREAVEAFMKLSFDLILMDIQMPEMDGYTASQRIRMDAESIRNPEIPIIAMTAHALESVRQDCLAAGMNDFLPKPVEIATMADVLKRWLEP
jgi:CheY-like chemotaxis protein